VPVSKPGGGGAFISVGSEFLHAGTDVRIPLGSTSAQTEINAAATFLSETYAAGSIRLSNGVYKTSGSIVLPSGIALLGEGMDATTIEKNGAFDAIVSAAAGVGTELSGITIKDLQITRNAADTNTQEHIDLDFVDDLIIENVRLVGAYNAVACDIISCDNATIRNLIVNGDSKVTTAAMRIAGTGDGAFIGDCRFFDCQLGMLSTQRNSRISNCYISDISDNDSSIVYGIGMQAIDNIVIENCHIEDIESTSGVRLASGIWIATTGDNIRIVNCHIGSVINTLDGANASGIEMLGFECSIGNCGVVDGSGTGIQIEGDSIEITNCMVSGNTGTGINIASTADRTQISSTRSTSNGTNFTDGGTNTTASVEDN
jgi:hypothetical protein